MRRAIHRRSNSREAYRAYDRAFAAFPHRVCYALKANSAGALLRLLARLGAGADIVSGFELEAALRAGFPAGRIVFSGVGKTDEELARGLAAGISEFNAESEHEMVRLSRIAAARGQRARVTLRGEVDDEEGRTALQVAAEAVPGVQGVDNQLTVTASV